MARRRVKRIPRPTPRKPTEMGKNGIASRAFSRLFQELIELSAFTLSFEPGEVECDVQLYCHPRLLIGA